MVDQSLPLFYAAWSNDEQNRFYSTSGGIFGELATHFLNKKWKIVGAWFNEATLLVEHIIIDSADDLKKIQQSKYLSSTMGNVFKHVKSELDSNGHIVFCGSPCQVAGLKCFLGKDYDNLLTIDFICRGMNSPKAFQSWLKEIEKEKGSKPIKVWFKYKDGGWNSSPTRTRVDFKNGESTIFEGMKNTYMYGYLYSNLYIRPSCGKCAFKGLKRFSDVTLADFWGIKKEFDDDKGTSLVIINSQKGVDAFDTIKESITFINQDIDLKQNPMIIKSVELPKKRHSFLVSLDDMPFSVSLKKHGGFETKKSFKEIIKSIFNSRSKK